MAAVAYNERFGYIDREYSKTKKFVIPPKFTWAWPFKGDLAQVDTALGVNTYYRFINRDGKFAFPGGFEEAFNFNESLAKVKDSRGWSYINTKGQFILSERFVDALGFVEGFGAVKLGNKWHYIKITATSKNQ